MFLSFKYYKIEKYFIIMIFFIKLNYHLKNKLNYKIQQSKLILIYKN